MKVTVNFRKMKNNDDITQYINRRLSFSFSHIKHEIQRASITLSDINGPKGGIDKQCRFFIKPQGLEPIIILERQPNVFLAVDRCIARASQSFIRRKKRKRQPLRLRPNENPRIDSSEPLISKS